MKAVAIFLSELLGFLGTILSIVMFAGVLVTGDPVTIGGNGSFFFAMAACGFYRVFTCDLPDRIRAARRETKRANPWRSI